MFYPFKFRPVYKDYIWGGRNLQKLGKNLPDGIVAESWEISCHEDGMSIIENGEFAGTSLLEIIDKYPNEILGNNIDFNRDKKFPLLIKFIDANDKLSVQVHPDDHYASKFENGDIGKNEMWYIMEAKPGAKIIYGVKEGITKEIFEKHINENKIGDCLSEIVVSAGDIINIPAGILHAIGEGILLAEVQQSSNLTYRVFDYDRTDKSGNKRELHIEKSLDVIDFKQEQLKPKPKGLSIPLDNNSKKTIMIANKYFAIELYNLNSTINDYADNSKFFIYIILEGKGEFLYNDNKYEFECGESFLIPASIGKYSIKGDAKILKAYLPNIQKDIIDLLKENGYSESEIKEKIILN